MSKAATYEDNILALLFTATALATVFQNHITSPIVSIFTALTVGDGADSDDQTTNEATYTPYARIAVVRSGAGWTVAAGSCSPDADIDFAEDSSGTETVDFCTFGSLTSGVGQVFYQGTVTPNIAVAVGVTPRLTTASTITEV